MPKRPEPRDRVLSRNEATKLIDGCHAAHIQLFVILALHTAGRAGAILDLTWDRIDLAARRLQLHDPGRSRTRKGRATVPINDTLAAALEAARKGAVTPFVVEWAGHKVGSIRHAFERAVERAGLDDAVTPHCLRHTAAVWMAEGGIPMEEIAQFLGHSDASTTYRIYARYSPEYLRRAARALEGQ
jgi:integrase